MRKSPAIWLLALMLLVAMVMVLNFSACAKQTESYTAPYTIERPDGTVYTVTPSDDTAGTISDGANTYSYRYKSAGNGYSVTFTYPDGETYTWTENSSSGRGEASLNFDFEKYPSGMVLKGLLRKVRTTQEDTSAKNWGLIFFLFFVGAVNTAWLRGVWYLDIGWKVKDAEPSEAALGWSRTVGVVLLIVAVVMMIV